LSLLDELSRSASARDGNAFRRLMEYEISRKTPYDSTPVPSAGKAIPVLRKKVSAERPSTASSPAAGADAGPDSGSADGTTPSRTPRPGAATRTPEKEAPVEGINMRSPDLGERDLCGQREDIDLDNCGSCKELFYPPESSFQGVVEQARRLAVAEQKPVLLTAGGEHSLFDPGGGKMRTTMRERSLAQLCRSETANDLATTTIMTREQARDYWKRQRINTFCRYPVEAFVWLTALLSSRGRLPEGTDVRQPVRLGQWAHLTRLTPTPHSLKTVALWSAGQTSLHDTPSLLGIPQRYVFAFYSAALALGMVER